MSEVDLSATPEAPQVPLSIPGVPEGQFSAMQNVGVGIDANGIPRFAAVFVFGGFLTEADATAFGDKLYDPIKTWVENTYAKRQS